MARHSDLLMAIGLAAGFQVSAELAFRDGHILTRSEYVQTPVPIGLCPAKVIHAMQCGIYPDAVMVPAAPVRKPIRSN